MPSLSPARQVYFLAAILLIGFVPDMARAQVNTTSPGPVIGVPGAQPRGVTPVPSSTRSGQTPTSGRPITTPTSPTSVIEVPSKPSTMVGSPAGNAPLALPQPIQRKSLPIATPTNPTSKDVVLPNPMGTEGGSPIPAEEAGDRNLPYIPSTVLPDIKPLEQQPVQLFDEEKLQEGRALLNTVLTASVVKVQEYPIDLATVLKLVETQNLFLQDFTYNAKIQNNLFYRSVAEMLPDVQGSYNQSRFQGVVQIFGNQTIPVYQTRIVPQATANWVINPGGRDVFTALAAKQRAKGAKFLLNQTIQEQLTDASLEYYELIAAGVNVANTQANIQEVRSQVALNEARRQAGIGTKLDLERAKTQLIEREQELIINENTLAKTQQALLRRLNLDPDVALIPPQVKAQAHILIPLNTNTKQLTDKAIANNPSLKVIQQEIRAVEYEGKSVLASIVPSVTLQAYINGTGPQIDQLGLGRFGGFAVQADLLNKLGTAIPLDYRTRRLQVAQQKIRLAEQVRTVQTEVINGFLDSRAGAQSIFTAQEQLDVAEESYRLAFGRYKAGLGINVDVLTAQTDLAIARVRVVRAIFDFNEAQVRLLKAIGEVSTPHILNGMTSNDFTATKTKPGP